MKQLSILAITILLAACSDSSAKEKKQSNINSSSFIIEGNIKGLSSGTAILAYLVNDSVLTDTSLLKNGNFIFKGKFAESQKVAVNFANDKFNGAIVFFAGNAEISIAADTADLSHPSIKGSLAQDEYEMYLEKIASVKKRNDELNRAGSQLFREGKITETVKDSLFKIGDMLETEKNNILLAFTKKYPGSSVSAWAILNDFGYDPDSMEPLFNALSATNQAGLYGAKIKELIDDNKKTAIGESAADFTENNTVDEPVSLSSFKGKYLLVDFWASWCGPCRVENPNVVKAYDQYKSQHFDILSVSLDSDKAAWLKAIKKDNLSWTQVSDLQSWKNIAAVKYGIKGIPFNLLLDKRGVIIAKNLRGRDLQNKLKEIFGF